MSHLISFSRYQAKCVKLFRQCDVTNFKIFLDKPRKQWLTGRKRGDDENTKT